MTFPGRCDGLIWPHSPTRRGGCDGLSWSRSTVIADRLVITKRGPGGEVEGGVVRGDQTRRAGRGVLGPGAGRPVSRASAHSAAGFGERDPAATQDTGSDVTGAGSVQVRD